MGLFVFPLARRGQVARVSGREPAAQETEACAAQRENVSSGGQGDGDEGEGGGGDCPQKHSQTLLLD